MDIEELHAFFAPVWQFVGRHQRPGNLAGGADLVDVKPTLSMTACGRGWPKGGAGGYPMFCDKSPGPMKNTSIPWTATSWSILPIASSVSTIETTSRFS